MEENADVNVLVEEETPEGEGGDEVDQGANPAGGDASPNNQKEANISKKDSNPKDIQAKVEVIP